MLPEQEPRSRTDGPEGWRRGTREPRVFGESRVFFCRLLEAGIELVHSVSGHQNFPARPCAAKVKTYALKVLKRPQPQWRKCTRDGKETQRDKVFEVPNSSISSPAPIETATPVERHTHKNKFVSHQPIQVIETKEEVGRKCQRMAFDLDPTSRWRFFQDTPQTPLTSCR